MTAWGCETPPTFWKWLRLAQLFHSRPWGKFSCGVGRYDSWGGEAASVSCVSCRKAWIRLNRQKFSFLWNKSSDVSGSFAWENIQAVPCQIMLETGYTASSDLSCRNHHPVLWRKAWAGAALILSVDKFPPSTSQTMPITGKCREDRVHGCTHLGCFQLHIPHKPASQEIFQ